MRRNKLSDPTLSIFTQLSPFPFPKSYSYTLLTQSPYKSSNDVMKIIDTPMVNKKINSNVNGEGLYESHIHVKEITDKIVWSDD